MTIRLLMIAIAPGLALALGIYLTDRYDREPILLLIKVFCFGALSVIPVAFVERVLMSFNLFGGILGAAFTAFVVAGFTEEFFKRKAVLYTAFYHRTLMKSWMGLYMRSFPHWALQRWKIYPMWFTVLQPILMWDYIEGSYRSRHICSSGLPWDIIYP